MTSYLKVFTCAFFFLVAVTAGFNAVIDPYGIYQLVRVDGINWPKIEMEKNVKMHKAYRVAKVKPNAVVLGTSRSALGIDPEHLDWGFELSWYNLGLSGAGTYVALRFLQHAQSVRPLKEAVFGLDFFTFNWMRQIESDYRSDFLLVDDAGNSNQFFKQKIMLASLLSMDALRSSLNTIKSTSKRMVMIDNRGMFYINPNYNLHDAFLGMEELYLKDIYLAGEKKEYTFTDATSGKSRLEEFRDLVIFSRDNGINMYYFISPPHAQQLEVIRVLGLWSLYEQWKREILDILQEEDVASSLWDFSGYNSVTTDDIFQPGAHYYIDSTHYNSTVGNMIISKMFYLADNHMPEDFGVILKPENIEEHLSSIRADQKTYHERYPENVLEIEQMAREAGII